MYWMSGLNSTLLTQVIRRGKLERRSDSPARSSGCPANLIAITLFNCDIETIKKFLISYFDVIFVYFSHPFYFCLHLFWLFKVAVNDPVMYLLISILMIDGQVGKAGSEPWASWRLVQLAQNAIFPWLDSHDYGVICYVEPWMWIVIKVHDLMIREQRLIIHRLQKNTSHDPLQQMGDKYRLEIAHFYSRNLISKFDCATCGNDISILIILSDYLWYWNYRF